MKGPDNRPGHALGVALVALQGTASKVQAAFAAYRDTVSVELIPDDQLKSLSPKDGNALLTTYPRDPRAHWFAGMHAADEGDLTGAEEHVRAGLAEHGVLRRSFGNRKLEAAMRLTLARVLDVEGRHADAVDAARPVCETGSAELPADLRAYCP